jgi:hypothetical protein
MGSTSGLDSCNAFANCGNVLAVQTRDRFYRFSRRNTSLRHCQSLFPGNEILPGRDSGIERARHIQLIVSRDKVSARKPTNWAPFARHREISVCMGLRGGAGRTRTSNQTIISR